MSVQFQIAHLVCLHKETLFEVPNFLQFLPIAYTRFAKFG